MKGKSVLNNLKWKLSYKFRRQQEKNCRKVYKSKQHKDEREDQVFHSILATDFHKWKKFKYLL